MGQIGPAFAKHIAMHTSVLDPPIFTTEYSCRGVVFFGNHFRKGVGGERLLPFTPLFSANQRRDAINDKLHRKGSENDAKQSRNHRAPGNAHGFGNALRHEKADVAGKHH